MLLFLNDIAGSEVLLILIFILMFFGSKSIPGIAKTLGKTMRQIKDATSDVQNEIKKSGLDIKKDLKLPNIVHETAEEIQRPMDQYVSDLEEVVSYQPPRKQFNVEQVPSENPIPLDQQLDGIEDKEK
jgi:sec-independent protein translocase protein TatA